MKQDCNHNCINYAWVSRHIDFVLKDLGIHNLNDWANRYARGPRSRIEDECDGVYTFEEIVEKAKEFSQNGRSMSSEDSRARYVPDLGGMDLLDYEFS